MINIAPLQSRITIAAARQLSELDPALDRMISLAEHNDYIAAAAQAEQLWEQRVYDVRTLGFYLFGVFMERGLLVLPDIISCIETAVTTNWPHLGPGHNLQRHLDGALRWLFINILGQLRFHQRKQDEQWKLWLQDWEQAPQQQILRRADELGKSLTEVVTVRMCQGHLYSLGVLLRGLPTSVPKAPPASPGELALAAVGRTDILNVEHQDMEPQDRSAGEPPRPRDASPTMELALSPALQLLLRKLAAFNQLVKLAKFRQAVIVYRDIKQSLEKFDPRIYLPSLLGEYFSNIVAHSQSLTQNLAATDDFTGQALEELYHLNIDLFLAAKS